MQDYLDPRNAEGMPNLADSAFAMDFLLAVKMGFVIIVLLLQKQPIQN